MTGWDGFDDKDRSRLGLQGIGKVVVWLVGGEEHQ